jgi:tol-pal system protein YbgF
VRQTAAFLPLLALLFCGCVATQSNIDDVHHQLNVFNSKLEEVHKNQKNLNDRLDDMSSDLMQGTEGSKDVDARISEMSAKFDDLKVMIVNVLQKNSGEIMLPSRLYSESQVYLMQKNYPQAVEGFNLYLEKYPEGEFAENAQYYLGDAYLGLNDWQEAAESYAKLLTVYEGSNFTASARLKYAQSLLKLENKSKKREAEDYLKSVVQDFPGYPEARIAENELDKLTKPEK